MLTTCTILLLLPSLLRLDQSSGQGLGGGLKPPTYKGIALVRLPGGNQPTRDAPAPTQTMVLPLPVMKTLLKPGPSACSRCFNASSAGSLRSGVGRGSAESV